MLRQRARWRRRVPAWCEGPVGNVDGSSSGSGGGGGAVDGGGGAGEVAGEAGYASREAEKKPPEGGRTERECCVGGGVGEKTAAVAGVTRGVERAQARGEAGGGVVFVGGNGPAGDTNLEMGMSGMS